MGVGVETGGAWVKGMGGEATPTSGHIPAALSRDSIADQTFNIFMSNSITNNSNSNLSHNPSAPGPEMQHDCVGGEPTKQDPAPLG